MNPETWEVNRCAPMPVGVAWAVAAVFDRKLWVIGGDIGLQTSRSNTVQIYDPATVSCRLILILVVLMHIRIPGG